jgi:CYTH domain-containing protein
VPSDPTAWLREPGHGQYARPERERRFLTRAAVPAGGADRLIEDRYLIGMRLRLRRVTREGRSVHKLTQKVRTVESDPAEVFITNIYLSEAEYAGLMDLPGLTVVKRCSVVQAPSHSFVVDDFHGALEGLRLAEVEVQDLAEPVALPEWLSTEVTDDDRFSGGSLAAIDAAGLSTLLNDL